MILKSENYYFILFSASVFSSFIFCIGFFPFANQNEVKFENKKFEESNVVDRSLLMIIDALRLDMVTRKNDMPYLHQLLESGDACSIKLKVDLPTVRKIMKLKI